MANAECNHGDELKLLSLAPASEPHKVLTPEQVDSKEVFVIGDVHGCCDELISLLDKAGVRDNPNAVIILVGDLINKGPKSKEVIDLVRKIGAFSVRGNHDQKCLHRLLELKKDRRYALEKKHEWLLQFDEKDIEFLSELPYTISIPSLNAIVVHAGLVPDRCLTQQEPWDMMQMRNLIVTHDDTGKKSYKTEQHSKPGEPWSEVWAGPEHVYYGHDAKRAFKQSTHATGLDDRCVYGGYLTGIFLTGEKQVVKVKAGNVHETPKLQKSADACVSL